LRDRLTGAITLVSVATSGGGTDDSFDPTISADGRYVVFQSFASNLVDGDANGERDVFLRDTVQNTTIRVSVSDDESEANSSSRGSISANGKYVAFQSYASNLVAGDTNGDDDIFVRDLTAGTTVRVTVNSDEVQLDSQGAKNPVVSDDGRYIAYESKSPELVANDTNGKEDIFLRDQVAGTTVRLSVGPNGEEADGPSYEVSMSSDGKYVAFESNATNLVANDTNGARDIFVRNMTTGTTTLVSRSTEGVIGDGASDDVHISDNGKYLVFESDATNLVAGDTNTQQDAFLHHRITGVTTRVSINSSGVEGNCSSDNPAVSNTGGDVAFQSSASNLASVNTPAPSCDAPAPTAPVSIDDSNYVRDIFMYSVPVVVPPTLPPTGANPVTLVVAGTVLLAAGAFTLRLRRFRTA
jgi:Tol biopolymer transport system component